MKRFFTGGWALLVLVLLLSVTFGVGVARAAGVAQYTLYWAKDDEPGLALLVIDGEKQEDVEGKMTVAATGGLFGNTGYNFTFSSKINEQLNERGGDDNSNEYFAVSQVYCSGETASLEEPSTKPYSKIDYVLGFQFKGWDKVTNSATYETHAGITKVQKIGDSGDEVVHLKSFGTGFNDLGRSKAGSEGAATGEDLEKVLSSGCLGSLTRGNLGQKTRNYHKLSPEEKKAVDKIIAEGASPTPSGTGGDALGSMCQGGAMGWLLCPLVNYMAKTIQMTAGLIDSLMQVRFLSSKDSAAQLETAWRALLSLANILLVVAFLFIIFSQATSMGISNYGIKKMLPRLVVAAVLMNLSFYICALAIDISNIVGGSIMGFIIGSGNTIESSVTNATGGGGDFISGAIFTAALVALAFFILVPVVLSIILVFIVLVGRQVVLMALVLISPLAFVAWLLPNTEKHFKKWYETFFQMLVIYPMVMLMFGASLFLANLVGAPGVGSNIIGSSTHIIQKDLKDK